MAVILVVLYLAQIHAVTAPGALALTTATVIDLNLYQITEIREEISSCTE